MTAAKSRQRDGEATVRKTTSVSVETAQKLDALARARKVSVSWLMSRALDKFLEQEGTN